MTSGAAVNAQSEPPASFEDVSQRLERLVRLVYIGSRPAVEDVDAVLRDVARLSRGELGVPLWRIAEFDDDVRTVARYRTRPDASSMPKGMQVPTQRGLRKRRQGPASKPPAAAELMPPVDLIRRAGAVVEAVNTGGTVTIEAIRALQEELRVAINIAASRREPDAAVLRSLHGRLARARGRVEARHSSSDARPIGSPRAASTGRVGRDSTKVRALRTLIPALCRTDKTQRVARAEAPNAHEPRQQAHRLARALELGQDVPQSQITDVLYRLAARRLGRSSNSDLAADRKAVQRLEAADRKARQRRKQIR